MSSNRPQYKSRLRLADWKSFYYFICFIILLGTVSRGKSAVLLDFVQITSPPPKFRKLIQFFSDVRIQDLKVSLELKILYIVYNIQHVYIHPKITV